MITPISACSCLLSSISGYNMYNTSRNAILKMIFFFLLYNIVLVLPYINMNPPWVYTCSPSWTPLLPPFPYHRSGSSQCTSPEHSVSCIEPGLAIHFTYDNIHVSMPLSQIIPPLPSPKESKRLFYPSVTSLQPPGVLAPCWKCQICSCLRTFVLLLDQSQNSWRICEHG